MSVSDKSCASNTPKPSNVFFVWYTELCRRRNVTPLLTVRGPKTKTRTILDFVGDKMKLEDWKPILNALYLDRSLHFIAVRSRLKGRPFQFDIDSEDKLRLLPKNVGCLWTDYVMSSLTTSLCNCVVKSNILRIIELDGIPLYNNYFRRYMEAVKKNHFLKELIFVRCPIKDLGCEEIFNSLRFLPNVEVLILNDCDLTHISAKSLGKLIRYQQLNRSCETWNNTLRYTDPPVDKIVGLKRITLNNNPLIGNEGLKAILHELEDDLWIKAIDMQNCGITEDVANFLLETVEINKNLQVADFRKNNLSSKTLNNILDIMRNRIGVNSEFQWYGTSTSLDRSNSARYTSHPSTANINRKSLSASMNISNPRLKSTSSLRKTKTVADFHKYVKSNSSNAGGSARVDLTDLQKQNANLSYRLQEEMRKRIEIEKLNKLLEKKVDKLKKMNYRAKFIPQVPKNFSQLLEILEILGINTDNEDFETLTNIMEFLKQENLNLEALVMEHVQNSVEQQNGFHLEIPYETDSNITERSTNKSNKMTTNMKVSSRDDETNEIISSFNEKRSGLLKKILQNEEIVDVNSEQKCDEYDDEQILEAYCSFDKPQKKKKKNQLKKRNPKKDKDKIMQTDDSENDDDEHILKAYYDNHDKPKKNAKKNKSKINKQKKADDDKIKLAVQKLLNNFSDEIGITSATYSSSDDENNISTVRTVIERKSEIFYDHENEIGNA